MDEKHIKEKLEKAGLKGYSSEKIMKVVKEEKLEKLIKTLKGVDSLLEEVYLNDIKNIFNYRTINYKTLLLWIDDRLEPLKIEFEQYGLKLPFPDYESACKWMVTESLDGVLSIPRLTCPTYNGMELFNVREYPFLITSLMINMPYKIYKNNKVELTCNKSVFLLALKSTIDSIVTYTGFDEICLLKYFFCNIKPEFERVTAKKNTTVGYRFIFELHTNDVTREEFLELYNLYRDEVKKTHRKRLSPEMIDFSLFIQKQDLPSKMNKKDYENLIQAYIEEYPHKKKEWIIKNNDEKEELNYRKMWAMHKRYKDKVREENKESIDLGYYNHLTNKEGGK